VVWIIPPLPLERLSFGVGVYKGFIGGL